MKHEPTKRDMLDDPYIGFGDMPEDFVHVATEDIEVASDKAEKFGWELDDETMYENYEDHPAVKKISKDIDKSRQFLI